jgi:hypothetical protein
MVGTKSGEWRDHGPSKSPFALLSMTAALQRPLKGSRISTLYPIKSIPPLSTLDSDFQLQEITLQTMRLNIHDVSVVTSIPGSSSKTEGISDDSNDKRVYHRRGILNLGTDTVR